MRIQVIRGGELTAGQRRLWDRLRRDDPALDSPCFAPELTLATAAVRDDVRIGILEEGGETVGFFPFQRDAVGRGEPVAAGISDFQGVVAARGARWSAPELLAGCGLASWEFDHLLASQEPFRPYHRELRESARIDLAGGYEEYVRGRRRERADLIKEAGRLRRKLEREAGPVRFEPHVPELPTLRHLMRLKSDQYQRTGQIDRFAIPWIVALLERLHGLREPGLAGMLSVLWARDQLVAAHMGMRSETTWHAWFTTYDRRFARYSPGVLLFLAMAESAASLGLTRIDLGAGETFFKERMGNGSVRVARGRVEALV